MVEFKRIFFKIIEILNNLKGKGLIQNYTLIGGIAVAMRGFIRATKDIDFLIDTDEDFFRKEFAKILEAKGYVIKIYKGEFNDPFRSVIRILDKDNTSLVDFILVHWKWQEEIVNSAEEVKLKNIPVSVIKIEDLIVLKLKAGSTRDILDVEELLKVVALSEKFDRTHLLYLAKQARVDKKLVRIASHLKIPLK